MLCPMDVHIDSIKVQLTWMVIARYCLMKWLNPSVPCSSHYFNGVVLVFQVFLRCEYDCGWKRAEQLEFLSESARKAGASRAKIIVLHLKKRSHRGHLSFKMLQDVLQRGHGGQTPTPPG